MRFRFPDENVAGEVAARQDVLRRIARWWAEFVRRSGEIEALFRHRSDLDLPGLMAEHLGAVDERLMWEFGPAVAGAGHRLVITTEVERHLRPMVEALLDRAPALPGWEFYGHRLAEPLEQAAATVEGRTGVSLKGWHVCLAPNDSGGIDLSWFGRRAAPEAEAHRAAAFVATECLLGEHFLDRYVDGIEIVRKPARGAEEVALDDLRPRAQAAVERWRERLPPEPLLRGLEARPWSLLELRPEGALDYPHQLDLRIGRTVHLPMWQRAHSGRPFHSERFSRCGETFCFLKLDGVDGLDPDGFPDKASIEDALDAALVPSDLGGCIGGGTGLRYSYVDLALTDVSKSIEVLRRVLRAGKVPRRTWLQFYDSELAAEWIGIHDDAPEPPGMGRRPA